MRFNQIIMNKDDKQFITTLIDALRTDINGLKAEITGFEGRLGKRITGVEGRITGVEGRLGKRITGVEGRLGKRITGVEDQLGKRITGVEDQLGKRITGVEAQLGEQIRHNGILIEELQDNVSVIAQNVETLNGDMTIVKTDINEIKTVIVDYPILRETVKKHSRQLAKLS